MRTTGSRNKKTLEIREFILENGWALRRDLARVTAEKFSLSRQAVHAHVTSMIRDGVLAVTDDEGKRRYEAVPIAQHSFERKIDGLDEDLVWREEIAPRLGAVGANVREICHYGFTEMVNNAIDHSEGSSVAGMVTRYPYAIKLIVSDDGIGIFAKLIKAFRLENEPHAMLELVKGKMTTDPARHSGEGIFFASRMFDQFALFSNSYQLIRQRNENWFLLAPPGANFLMERHVPTRGTGVFMYVATRTERTSREVFDEFADANADYAFSKTHVPIALAKQGQDNLVSRSQAKRLLARFDKFSEVRLDFAGVDSIGQAFADEVFRVFQLAHPDVKLVVLSARREVSKMIKRARGHAGG